MSIEQLFAQGNKPNIMLIITDQERALSEWPGKYRSTLGAKLAAMNRLAANGLSFEQAFTAACMCSPSRATFQTSQYPIVTGCTLTGESALPSPAVRANMASVLSAAGYRCYWIGKWHLLWPNEPGMKNSDLSPWGWQVYEASSNVCAWDPPDAGITLDDTYLGGGTKGNKATNRNDQRYVTDAITFLTSAPPEPWCLVVSLVNPHDVHLGYEGLAHNFYQRSAYQGLNVPLPHTVFQDVSKMPRGQSYSTWKKQSAGTGAQRRHFGDFYAHLVEYVDSQIGAILDAMTSSQIDSTLIVRFSDHGEMGLAHNLVEKFVNAYGQCLHVPLVFSNPVAWPSPATTQSLASTVDLVPTFASLLNVQNVQWSFVGTDLSPVLEDPTQEVQSFVHYTYDDEGDASVPSVIRAIRSQQWAYAVYLDSVTSLTSGYSDADWEMYDLVNDPEERVNLAGRNMPEQDMLDVLLQVQMILKNTAPLWYELNWPPQKTSSSIGGPPVSVGGGAVPPIAKLPGITGRQVGALSYAGVRSIAALLARTRTPVGRESLASLAKLNPKQLERWIEGITERLQALTKGAKRTRQMPTRPRPGRTRPPAKGPVGSRRPRQRAS